MKAIQFPLIRVTLAFIIGLFLGKLFVIPPVLWASGILFSALTVGVIHYYTRKFITPPYALGGLLLLVFVGVGGMRIAMDVPERNPYHFTHFLKKSQTCTLVVTLESQLRTSKTRTRYVAEVHEGNGQKTVGKIVVGFPKNEQIYKIGELYGVTGHFLPLQTAANPGQFDYSAYLKNKHWYGQLLVTNAKWLGPPQKSIPSIADGIRQTVYQRLKKHLNESDLALIMALILGQQQDMNADLIQAYQKAGAVHILSVSGLHVGFVLIFIQTLLKPIPNTRRFRRLKIVMVVLGLWSFGFLAGLAPSVLRSVVMFSGLAVGEYLRRSSNSYNTLFTSLFLILLWEPHALWDVGLQLSYTAVFFILWLHPILQNLWSPQSKIGRYIRDLLSVSLAAQLGTLPLSLYYFHQFPGLFFVTNLLLLPGMGVLMGLGLLCVVMAYFNWIWTPLLKLVQWALNLMNGIIRIISEQEEMVWSGIPMNLTAMFLLYSVIVMGVFALEKRNFNCCRNFLGSILVFQLTILGIRHYYWQNEAWILFHQRKATLIAQQQHHQYQYLATTNAYLIPLEAFALSRWIAPSAKQDLRQNRFWLNGKKIALVDEKGRFPKNRPHILIVTNNPRCGPELWLRRHRPDWVVLDGSNAYHLRKSWKECCYQLKIPFHDTSEKGSFSVY
ncbi:ComEC/Rec2 family competence protein [Flavobacterium sp.]|jgi:competence protein ComEC|uniref:ComEC/Rec2 family competence protein n=1 Tax=Flavobacterium sp. TaxID=239 RepID=UPI0022C6AD99|nr:ComEC/Rec2 family competence protein [Flavobacterium sp.]MCZ8143892.1 ComEC/Rec2 family competence protein [Flavobacterium sp.]MCZ8367539.1 ComEC/Rec2 family competence protein [Flavobacterium sp.]